MKLAPPEKQFLRPEEENAFDYTRTKFAIIPAPLEQTVSYGHGTAGGPMAILEASSQVEFWDAELHKDLSKVGIATLEPLVFNADPEKNMAAISDTFRQVLRDGKIPVLLGGEHTVTLGAVSGLADLRREKKIERPFTILQFDAHADLRAEYEGTIYSHAAVMRQCLERFPAANLVQVGIRAICEEEEEFISANAQGGRIATFFAHERRNWSPEKIVNSIRTEDVYITFDVDGLDPSIIPATGTPVPDGLLWRETMEILRLVAAAKSIVAMDVVELAPRPGFEYCDFATALLTYKMMAYVSEPKV